MNCEIFSEYRKYVKYIWFKGAREDTQISYQQFDNIWQTFGVWELKAIYRLVIPMIMREKFRLKEKTAVQAYKECCEYLLEYRKTKWTNEEQFIQQRQDDSETEEPRAKRPKTWHTGISIFRTGANRNQGEMESRT